MKVKSKLKLPKFAPPSTVEEIVYPCLMFNPDFKEKVVLFTEPRRGVVVSHERASEIGRTQSDYKMVWYKPLPKGTKVVLTAK